MSIRKQHLPGLVTSSSSSLSSSSIDVISLFLGREAPHASPFSRWEFMSVSEVQWGWETLVLVPVA